MWWVGKGCGRGLIIKKDDDNAVGFVRFCCETDNLVSYLFLFTNNK